MFATAASCGVPYILMHRQGDFKTMQRNPHYEHVVLEVFDYLNERLQQLRTAGVKDVIIDPGFGFGKSLEHNFDLLRHLSWFRRLETPILVGL